MQKIYNDVDRKIFEQAERIAHGYFWLSDCPSVTEKSWDKIQEKQISSMAEMVAIICHFAHKAEIEHLKNK